MSEKLKIRLALLLGILLVSIFPVLIKMEFASGLISAFYRMAIAAAVLFPYATFTRKVRIKSPKYFALTLLCGCIFASDIAVWNISIQSSTATQATLLSNLAPLWVGLFSLLFLNVKPAFNFWVGMLIALFGLVVLIGVSVFLDFSFDLAFALAILSGIFYAFYFLLSKYVLEKVAVLPFMAYSTLAATVYLAIINIGFKEQFFNYSMQAWATFAVQGLFCQVAAWLLLGYAMKHMRPTRISLSMLSQVLVTTILAVFFLGEEVTRQTLIGGLFILLGIGITFREKPILKQRRIRF